MSRILERTDLQVQKVVADQQLLQEVHRSLTNHLLLKVYKGTDQWHTQVLLVPNSICCSYIVIRAPTNPLRLNKEEK